MLKLLLNVPVECYRLATCLKGGAVAEWTMAPIKILSGTTNLRRAEITLDQDLTDLMVAMAETNSKTDKAMPTLLRMSTPFWRSRQKQHLVTGIMVKRTGVDNVDPDNLVGY